MEIEEIAGETKTEVKERVVFATVEREVWSDGQMRAMKKRYTKINYYYNKYFKKG